MRLLAFRKRLIMSDKKRRNSFFFVADITVKSEDETPTDDLFCKQ